MGYGNILYVIYTLLSVTNDEELPNLMVEVEKVMNNRPLVPVYTDESAFSALNASDILLLRQYEGFVDDPDIALRYSRRWRQANT